MSHVRHIGRFQLGRKLSLPLVPAVLKPDLHLRLGEAQGRCQARSLGRTEVPE